MADDGIDVAVACRVLNVSRSGYYDWVGRPASARQQENEDLLKLIEQVHRDSRGTYGSPRVHAELTLGLGLPVNLKRVARLMRQAGLQGLYRRRRRGCTVRDPAAEPASDLIQRNFTADRPNRLWITDITEHPTDEGKLYCAAVMDAYSRLIVGWSIAPHMRTELVTDALGMAIVRRQPENGPKDEKTILHSDHGTQGEFKRSSQHLDVEVVRWDGDRGGRQPRLGGRRCGLRGGRRWRDGSTGSGSGRRSRAGSPVRRPVSRPACRQRLERDGFVRVAACRRSAVPRFPAVT
jgi:transposase InsO family protein